MKINSVETFDLSIPVKPEKLSFGSINAIDYVITRVGTDRSVGYGEAAVLQGPTWSEESQESIKSVIDNYLSKVVLGNNCLEYHRILHLMDARVKGNNFAKAAIEMAVLDCASRELNVPIYELLGGKYRDSVPLSWTIANNDSYLDAKESKERVKKGWKILKIKTGSLSLLEDLKRIATIRRAVGDEISLRVDANQGWTINQALASLETLEDYKIDLLEQPLQRWDFDGLAEVARRSKVPIMADESLCSIQDAVTHVEKKSATIFSYKMTKMGGIVNSRTINSIATSYRISSYVGCMIETSIGTAGYLQFCASIPELEYGCELFGPLRIEQDVVKEGRGVLYERGKVKVPNGPGLGIEVEEKKLQRLSKRNRAY